MFSQWEEEMEDTNNNNEDLYDSMLNFTPISSSQEQLLHRTPFVGDTPNSPYSDNAELPVASAGIIMESPPETQTQDAGRDSSDGPQDVFHTPPEESSIPSSDDQRRMLTVDVDRCCAVNQAVDVDSGTQGFVDGFSDGSEFVDLGRDTELGFSEVQLTQEIGFAEEDGLGEIPECHQFDEFRVLEKEFSELPVKKLKLSEQNLGFDSSKDCFGVHIQEAMANCDADAEKNPCSFEAEELQPQENALQDEQMPMDDGNGDDFCRENSVDNNFENQVEVDQLETITSDGDVNLIVENNKSSDEVIEASGMREMSDDEAPCLRVLPPSIRGCLENALNELGSEKGHDNKKCPVFDVLRVLSEQTDEDEEEDVDDVSLLEAAKIGGITFPCPRWWPDNDSFNNQGIV